MAANASGRLPAPPGQAHAGQTCIALYRLELLVRPHVPVLFHPRPPLRPKGLHGGDVIAGMAGPYNVTLVVSSPLVKNTTVVFHDMIENAIVFEVEEKESAKLWNKVYIPNTVSVTKCKSVGEK